MTLFFLNDTKVFIHYRYPPQEGELPLEDHHAFLVDDVDPCCQQLMNQGLDLEILPQDFYWGRSAYLRDPDRRLIKITQKGN